MLVYQILLSRLDECCILLFHGIFMVVMLLYAFFVYLLFCLLLFHLLPKGFFLSVSPESIIALAKHAAEKNKVSNLGVYII